MARAMACAPSPRGLAETMNKTGILIAASFVVGRAAAIWNNMNSERADQCSMDPSDSSSVESGPRS